MAFNADTKLSELQTPEYHHRGRTYRGRFLSIEEWFYWGEQLRRAGALDSRQGNETIRAFCDAVFPPRFWDRLLGRPSVATLVLTLPPVLQFGALASFTASLVQALTPTPAPGGLTATEPVILTTMRHRATESPKPS